jgi:hypothetical protein
VRRGEFGGGSKNKRAASLGSSGDKSAKAIKAKGWLVA